MTGNRATSLHRAIGLMSGTSMDGIDAALVETDGERAVVSGEALSIPYDTAFVGRLRELLGRNGRDHPDFTGIESELTDRHADAVLRLIDKSGLSAGEIAVIGFHGQTIFHDPSHGATDQIGDGMRLAEACGIDVIADFRSNDMDLGGEGAPFAPLYHAALAVNLERPLAVLNLGGVGNVTWLGTDGAISAFDTGPANALMDDWCRRHTDKPFDENGALAASGTANEAIVEGWLANDFFAAPPPKSLDRNSFDVSTIDEATVEDGMATLLAFTVRSIALARDHMVQTPVRWLVTGGGRRNASLMAALAETLGVPVEPVEGVGWDGDALEAQAFAYLAVRSLKGLALSLPETTGAKKPATGGRLFRHS